MSDSDIAPDFQLEGCDRRALLADAAERLNVLSGYLGPDAAGGEPEGAGVSSAIESPQARLLKELREDVAQFTDYPIVEKITTNTFTDRGLAVPVRFQELARTSNLYCIHFPIVLFPKRGWAFNRLTASIEFNPGDPEARLRPKAYRILPEREFQTQLEAKTHLEFNLDENLEFKTGVDGAGAPANFSAGASAKVGAGIGIIAGPFTYRVVRAKIEHSAVGLAKVIWRLDGAEFFQEDDFPLVVVLSVPKETKQVTIAAAMQASRHFNTLSADLLEVFKELGRRFRRFAEAGMPIEDTKSWDITGDL